MRQLAILLLALAPAALGQFIPDEASRTTRPFPAFTRNGKPTTQAREVLLQGWDYKGTAVMGNLFVLFDSRTQYFLWMYGSRATNPGKIYVADLLATLSPAYITDKALVLICLGTPGLQIWESSKKASSLDDAEQQALSTLKAEANLIGRNGSWPWPPKLVPLPNLSMEFYIPPMHAAPRREVNVVSISPVPDGLEVVIEGEWQEKLTLSPSYEILRATRVTP